MTKKELVEQLNAYADDDEIFVWFEDEYGNMINEGEREKGVAMDETTSVERAGLEPIDGCYYQSRDTFSMPKGHGIQWLDNKCGFVKFNTYEEKFRYALGRYKVPQDWIDRFVAEFPGRKWDDTEIYLIQSDYRNSVKPIDEVIDFYKGWLS